MVSVVKTAGDVTASAVKTTGSVAVTTVKVGGSVAAGVVKTGVSVAETGVRTAASLAKTGAVVILDTRNGAIASMPWTHGISMSVATQLAKVGLNGISGRVVRKNKEIEVPRDRWAQTYLEDGDVVVLAKSEKR